VNNAISWKNGTPTTDREYCRLCETCVDECYAEAREFVGREMTIKQVYEEIERDRIFYDESGGGVTFSGGEPLSQPDFLRGLLDSCRAGSFHTALDTCGYAPWDTVDSIRGSVDLFLYDLRLMDDGKHMEATGVPLDTVLENLKALSGYAHRIILRIPVIPKINDDKKNIQRMGEFAARLPHLECVELLRYHKIGVEKYARLDRAYNLSESEPPTEERMEEIAQMLRASGLCVT
jgi:pyruvate formate lyase activating enzyme